MKTIIFGTILILQCCIILILERCATTDSGQQKNIANNSNAKSNNTQNSAQKNSNQPTETTTKDVIDDEYSAEATPQNAPANPVQPVNPVLSNAAKNTAQSAQKPLNNLSNATNIPPANIAVTQLAAKAQPAPVVELVGKAFSELKYVAYDYQRSHKTLEITLHVDGSNEYEILTQINMAHQKELVVRLPNSDCQPILRRHLDSEEFSSPVAYVRTRKLAKLSYLDVILTLRDDISPKIEVRPHLIVLKFEVPTHYYSSNAKVADVKKDIEKAEILENPTQNPIPEKRAVSAKNNSMEWLPLKTVELKAEEIALPKETIKQQPLVAPLGNKKRQLAAPVGPMIPAAPAIPLAPTQGPVMPQALPRQQNPGVPKGPSNLKFKDIDDGGFDEKDKARSEDEKFEVQATGRVFSVAQELFDGPSTLPAGLDLTAAPNNSTEDVVGEEVGKRTTPVSQKKAIRIDFRAAPLSEVIRALTAETKINFIIPPDIGKALVTLNLRDVPWDVALKALLESNNLGMQEMGPNLVRIDGIRKFADDKKQLEEAKKSVERLLPTKVLVMRLSYGKASQISGTIEKFLESVKAEDYRTKVQFDDRTNSIIVEATPIQLAKVKILIERIDLQTPQVRITSRILEVTKTFNNSLGISWGSPLNFDQGRGLGFGGLPFPNNATSDFAFDSNLPSKIFNTSVNLGSINNSVALKFKISAEEKKGTTEVLQNQTIMVQDNEEASIDAGLEDVYLLPGSQTAPSTLQTVKYLLSLKVTPRITADGSVQMKLNIASDSPLKTNAGAQAGKQSRAITTTLLRKSGETAVIGGLYATQKDIAQTGIPILMDIPLLGALFRGTEKKDLQRELMILITPAIVNSSNTYLDNPASKDKLSSNLPATVSETKIENATKVESTNTPSPKLSNSGDAGNNATLNSNTKNSNGGE